MVTLLKNQMKSAMMAKPADKNIQSGNSRVKVTLYGQVNRAIRFANTGENTEITSVDNDGSSSRLGVRAVGKANPNLTIGALHELEWQENPRSGAHAGNDGTVHQRSGTFAGHYHNVGSTNNGRVRPRHVDLWLDHKNLGKLSMGHGSIAGDAAGLYELTGVSHVYGFAGANGTDGTTADASVKRAAATDRTDEMVDSIEAKKKRGFRPFNFFGARENRIRYDTPSLMGARASASYGEKKGWSVGLTYAGAPPGVKNFSALFAAGYRKNDNDTSAWAVSGGIKHSSGFNISGSYDADGEQNPTNGLKESQWGVSLGWTGKFNDSGATAIGIGFNRSSDGRKGQANQYWVAFNQSIDAAAADVYVGVSFDSGTDSHIVSVAEGLTENRAAADAQGTTPAVTALAAAKTPCYSPNPNTAGENVKLAAGKACALDREGVMNFVVGVRIKF